MSPWKDVFKKIYIFHLLEKPLKINIKIHQFMKNQQNFKDTRYLKQRYFSQTKKTTHLRWFFGLRDNEYDVFICFPVYLTQTLHGLPSFQ
jgi:steroid 5-alpha reductase family enzyme